MMRNSYLSNKGPDVTSNKSTSSSLSSDIAEKKTTARQRWLAAASMAPKSETLNPAMATNTSRFYKKNPLDRPPSSSSLSTARTLSTTNTGSPTTSNILLKKNGGVGGASSFQEVSKSSSEGGKFPSTITTFSAASVPDSHAVRRSRTSNSCGTGSNNDSVIRSTKVLGKKHDAAIQIQTCWRSYRARKLAKRLKLKTKFRRAVSNTPSQTSTIDRSKCANIMSRGNVFDHRHGHIFNQSHEVVRAKSALHNDDNIEKRGSTATVKSALEAMREENRANARGKFRWAVKQTIPGGSKKNVSSNNYSSEENQKVFGAIAVTTLKTVPDSQRKKEDQLGKNDRGKKSRKSESPIQRITRTFSNELMKKIGADRRRRGRKSQVIQNSQAAKSDEEIDGAALSGAALSGAALSGAASTPIPFDDINNETTKRDEGKKNSVKKKTLSPLRRVARTCSNELMKKFAAKKKEDESKKRGGGRRPALGAKQPSMKKRSSFKKRNSVKRLSLNQQPSVVGKKRPSLINRLGINKRESQARENDGLLTCSEFMARFNAATTIQSCWRGHLGRKYARKIRIRNTFGIVAKLANKQQQTQNGNTKTLSLEKIENSKQNSAKSQPRRVFDHRHGQFFNKTLDASTKGTSSHETGEIKANAVRSVLTAKRQENRSRVLGKFRRAVQRTLSGKRDRNNHQSARNKQNDEGTSAHADAARSLGGYPFRLGGPKRGDSNQSIKSTGSNYSFKSTGSNRPIKRVGSNQSINSIASNVSMKANSKITNKIDSTETNESMSSNSLFKGKDPKERINSNYANQSVKMTDSNHSIKSLISVNQEFEPTKLFNKAALKRKAQIKAATAVQTRWRCYLARKRYHKLRFKNKFLRTIQLAQHANKSSTFQVQEQYSRSSKNLIRNKNSVVENLQKKFLTNLYSRLEESNAKKRLQQQQPSFQKKSNPPLDNLEKVEAANEDKSKELSSVVGKSNKEIMDSNILDRHLEAIKTPSRAFKPWWQSLNKWSKEYRGLEVAAIRIQDWWRMRQVFSGKEAGVRASTSIVAIIAGFEAKRKERERVADIIGSLINQSKHKARKVSTEAIVKRYINAAITIQRCWVNHYTMLKIKNGKKISALIQIWKQSKSVNICICASIIQCAWRIFKARRVLRHKKMKEARFSRFSAACAIQRYWRGLLDRKKYRSERMSGIFDDIGSYKKSTIASSSDLQDQINLRRNLSEVKNATCKSWIDHNEPIGNEEKKSFEQKPFQQDMASRNKLDVKQKSEEMGELEGQRGELPEKLQNESSTEVDGGKAQRFQGDKEKKDTAEQIFAARTIQTNWRTYRGKETRKQRAIDPNFVVTEEKCDAILMIQRCYRGLCGRRRFEDEWINLQLELKRRHELETELVHQTNAALEIQRCYRGLQGRQRFEEEWIKLQIDLKRQAEEEYFEMQRQKEAVAIIIQGHWRIYRARKFAKRKRIEMDVAKRKKQYAALKIQEFFILLKTRQNCRKEKIQLNHTASLREGAALTIQKWWYMNTAQERLQQMKIERELLNRATTPMQALARGFIMRKKYHLSLNTIPIQAAIRGYLQFCKYRLKSLESQLHKVENKRRKRLQKIEKDQYKLKKSARREETNAFLKVIEHDENQEIIKQLKAEQAELHQETRDIRHNMKLEEQNVNRHQNSSGADDTIRKLKELEVKNMEHEIERLVKKLDQSQRNLEKAQKKADKISAKVNKQLTKKKKIESCIHEIADIFSDRCEDLVLCEEILTLSGF